MTQGPRTPAVLLSLPHPPRRQDSLGDGVLSSLDLAEELLWDAVVEGELAVEHGEENHTQGPHVTRLAPVWPAWGQSTRTLSWNDVPGQLLTPNPTFASDPFSVLPLRASKCRPELLLARWPVPCSQDDVWVCAAHPPCPALPDSASSSSAQETLGASYHSHSQESSSAQVASASTSVDTAGSPIPHPSASPPTPSLCCFSALH